jgi:heme exporter protein C
MSFWEYSNPTRFMAWSGKAQPVTGGLALLFLGAGLATGFFGVPPDQEMGSSVRILFVHVPAAFMAINAWGMMVVASLIWLVRRHHVSALAARAAAPAGAVFTLIALITGAIWGEPMWGSWWEWEPRLTAFLVLFLFYLGYLALSASAGLGDRGHDLTAILCLIGSVFALIARYAVNFWDQGLHQGASLSLDAETHVANVYYHPLIAAMAGLALLFLTLVLAGTRTAVRMRRTESLGRQAQ